MPALRVPLLTFFLVIGLCFGLGENFPFSNFPMYRSFSKYSYYIYFADGDDQPIPIKNLTGHRTSALKKIYNDELKKTRKTLENQGVEIKGFQFMTPAQRKPAGDYTLNWLYQNAEDGHENWHEDLKNPIRLHHVHIRLEGKEVTREDEFISEK